jgi:hypothetical protein
MLNDYAVTTAEKGFNKARRQTLRERLEENKRMLEERLANLNSALKFIDKNPEFENFHNIIGKAGF